MNIHWTPQLVACTVLTAVSLLGLVLIIRINLREYGLLYILSAVTGLSLCFIFVILGFYSFPFRLFPEVSQMPSIEVLTAFPFWVLLSVRYSPSSMQNKIFYYWAIVNLGTAGEVAVRFWLNIIKYDRFWDTWDSYTWWWIYFLIFDYVGGIVVSKENRRPIDEYQDRYAMLRRFIIQLIIVATTFLAGVFVGRVT